MNIFALIFWIASIVILLLAALVGVLGGLRRGPLRGLVKLLALVVSVALSLVIALCLRGLAINTLMDLLSGFVPQELQDYTEMIELVANIPASVALLIAFWPIFMVVRLLMLIPQKLICKLLPCKLGDPAPRKKKIQKIVPAPAPEEASASEEIPAPAAEETEVVSADALPEESAELTADAVSEEIVDADGADGEPALTEPAPAQDEPTLVQDENAPAEEAPAAPVQETVEIVEEEVTESVKRPIGLRILWNAGAVLLGVLSSVLMVCTVIMPMSCLISRAGDSLARVTEVMAEERYGEYSDEISEISRDIVSSPLLVTTDFVYGKTVFEPIMSFTTDYGRINLLKEMDTLTTVACDVFPVYLHLEEDGELESKDDELIEDAVKQIADSEFLMAVGTFAIQSAAEDFELFEDEEMTPAKETLQESVDDLLENLTPETLADHLETVANLIAAAGDSELLEMLMDDSGKEPEITDFAERETLGEIFGVLYDDEAVRELLVPVINFGAETVFMEAGITPVYSTVDLGDYSRKEVVAEADVLCDAILAIAEFADSVEQGGDNLSAYRLASAGKALDCLKKSILFNACYDELVQVITSMNVGSAEEEGTNQLMSAITEALQKSDSAEKLMNSAQSVLVLGDQLQKGEKKGRENQELVASVDTLLNQTDKASTEILADLAEDVFEGRSDGIGSDQKTQMIQDCVKALNSINEEDDVDVEAEADAVQVIYDLTMSDANAFEDVSEKETIDAMLNSKLAMAVVETLNQEGRDYGVKKNMDAENKANILAALAESNADDASKDAIATFFGVQ